MGKLYTYYLLFLDKLIKKNLYESIRFDVLQ